MSRRRRNVSVLLAASALALPSAAGARASGLAFASIPKRFVQGAPTTVVVTTHPTGVICSLSIRFSDGTVQSVGPAGSANARVKWTFRVDGAAAPGHARVTVSCARAGTVRRTVLVVGSVIPARITVVKDGYSIRQEQFGGGRLSYGIVLQNTSPNEDALQVYTLVNFVGPDGKLVGSSTSTLPGIPAGQQFGLGGDISFFGTLPTVTRLEIVVEIGKRQKHALKMATISNIYIEPSVFEPSWVGAVDGEVSNPESSLVLQNTALSTVLFDAAGNVIGGGSGFAGASLPPGAREFFKITLSSDIPVGRAASAMVSAIGSYQAP
jgi:hypothetical protein